MPGGAADPNVPDVFENFQQQGPTVGETVQDIISFWAITRLDPHSRNLAKMAIDFLSILAMSAEPERVFSGAKVTLSARRCALGDDSNNALECLKSWQRDSLVSGSSLYTGIENMDQMLAALNEK